MRIPHPEIFKAYDIRGIVGQSLTESVVEAIGRAVGSEALAAGDSAVVVGRDGRLSGPCPIDASNASLNVDPLSTRSHHS